MRVSLLGPFQVMGESGVVPLPGRRMAGLVARLALAEGRPVPADALVDALWDDAPEGGIDTLRRLASRTRVRLEEHGVPIGPMAEGGGYRLEIDPTEVDAVVFERLAGEGGRLLRERAWDRAGQVLEEALALWRGEPLGGIDAEFAIRTAHRLADLRLSAAEDRIDALAHIGDPAALLPELRALCAAHPARERCHGLLMRLLNASGQRAAALRAYEDLRRVLADELGTDPPPHLVQLHGELLRERQPPARCWTNPYLTRFFGRREELAAIEVSLARTRLVTLHGPGGVGKTRLAAEYAAGAAARVCFVELGPLREADSMVDAMAATLGTGEALLAASGGRTARLVSALSAVPTLLVLDNCEHLIDPAADLTARLLADCPELQILATSREPLAIVGEALVRIEPFIVAERGGDAVAMFTELVSLVRPEFVAEAGNEEAVLEICRRLDGLPLGIELAAARARSMTVAEIAQHLDQRFRLLAGARRSGSARHRTMRAVLDWTWNLLSAEERLLARRVSILPAGVTVAAARALCAPDLSAEEVPFLLSALTDKSLIHASSTPRGELRHRLMETPRLYLRGQLREAGEEGPTREAALRYCTDLAQSAFGMLLGEDQIAGLELLDTEHDTILDSLRHASAGGDLAAVADLATPMSWYWIIRGRYEEAAGWLGELDHHRDSLDATTRAVCAAVLAVLPREVPAASDVVGTAKPGTGDPGLGGPGGVAPAAPATETDWGAYPPLAMILTNHRLLTGDIAGLRAYATMAGAHPHPWVRAAGHAASALVAESDGDATGAERDVEEAVAAFRDVGDFWTTAQLLAGLAGFQSARGDVDGAVASLRQALELERSLGPSQRRTAILIGLGGELLRAGRADEAESAFADALDPSMAPTAESRILGLVGLADLALVRGSIGEARRILADVRGLLDRPLADPVFLGVVVGCREVALALAGDDGDRPLQLAWQVWGLAAGLGDAAVRAETAEVVADALTQAGATEAAARALGTAAYIRGRRDESSPRVARLVAALTDRLGAEDFAAAYAEGSSGTVPLAPD